MIRSKSEVASASVNYAYRKLTPLDATKQVGPVGKTSIVKAYRKKNCRGYRLEKEFLRNMGVRRRANLLLNCYFFNI